GADLAALRRDEGEVVGVRLGQRPEAEVHEVGSLTSVAAPSENVFSYGLVQKGDTCKLRSCATSATKSWRSSRTSTRSGPGPARSASGSWPAASVTPTCRG